MVDEVAFVGNDHGASYLYHGDRPLRPPVVTAPVQVEIPVSAGGVTQTNGF